MSLLPILTCKIKGRAGDWAVEGRWSCKFGKRRERGRERRLWRRRERRRCKDNGAEQCGLEKSKVIRNLIHGEFSDAVIDLPNLGM